MRSEKATYYLLLLAIVVLGIWICINTILGPNAVLSGSDDFFNLLHANIVVHHGFNTAYLAPSTFSTSYIFDGAPALFMALFGGNLITESMLDIICLVGTIIVVFYTAKLLQDNIAGIFAALTFVFIPIVAAEGATAGNCMPVAFFASLAVLMLLLGVKMKRTSYYTLSGFFGFLGALAGSVETFVVFAFLIPALAFLLFKSKEERQRGRTLWFFAGIALAIFLIMVLGYVLQSNPLMYFIYNLGNGSYPPVAQPNANIMIGQIFPDRATYILDSLQFSLTKISDAADNYATIYLFGLFGYVMLAGTAYLLLRKRYAVLLPLVWFAALFLYLAYGKSNLMFTGYIKFYPRFMTVLAPPIAVAIGMAMGEFVRVQTRKKNGKDRKKFFVYSTILLLIVFCAYFFVVINSLSIMNILHKYNYIETFQVSQTASVLSNVSKSIPIYVVSGLNKTPGNVGLEINNSFGSLTAKDFISTLNQEYGIGIDAYAGFDENINYSAVFDNCSALRYGYIVWVYSTSYTNKLQTCGNLTAIFVPSLNESQLGLGKIGYLQNVTVYKRLGSG